MPQTTHQTDKAKNHSKDNAWGKMQSYYNVYNVYVGQNAQKC